MKVGLALIGASPFTSEAHAPAVRACEDIYTVVAIYNRSVGPAEALAAEFVRLGLPQPDVYSGADGLAAVLAREDVLAVSVVLASHIAPAVVRAALQANKHVMSEKPVAADVATGVALVAEYEAEYKPKGLLWGVLENYRFESGLVRAGELAGTAIGTLALVESRWHAPMAASLRFAAHGRTNLLLEGGCHYTAALRVIADGGGPANAVVSACGLTSHRAPHLQAPDTMVASYAFASGVTATMTVSFAPHQRRSEMLAAGSAGSVALQRGVHEGKHGYHVECSGSSVPTPIREFLAFDGVQGAVKCFGLQVAAALAGEAACIDPRLSPAAALEDIRMVEMVTGPLPAAADAAAAAGKA